MADNELRQRAGKSASTTKSADSPKQAGGQPGGISILDIIRVLVTLAVAAVGGSYYLTSGASLTYGYNPWFLNVKAVQQYFSGPLRLTPEQLSKFDGSDPEKPLYLVVNASIFDVTPSRRMYGPGASYNTFVGREATRAYVTGCFLEDRTHDLRDAWKAFMPIDDPDEVISSGDRKTRHEQEVRAAKAKVDATIEYWETFYRNSDKYVEVGKVVGLKEPTGPPPKLCDYAEKGRPKRQAASTA